MNQHEIKRESDRLGTRATGSVYRGTTSSRTEHVHIKQLVYQLYILERLVVF